jgi:hypothetical protein
MTRWGRILRLMKPARAMTRRYLPSSPFKAPEAGPPPEQFQIDDRVTHDQHGLGRIVGVEEDIAVLVSFGGSQLRVTSPFSKLTKL